MMNLISMASSDCNVPEDWVRNTIKTGMNRVKLLKIAKRNSDKKRIISRPSTELEILQRWLTLRFFNALPVHESAMAFMPNRSILKNAKQHANSSYFIRVDFTDFFHSINYADLFNSLRTYSEASPLIQDTESMDFVKRVCFNYKGQLPIGYISSPVISNIVMLSFDQSVKKLIDDNKQLMGEGIYTRYADDIVFSTNIKGGCAEFFKKLERLVLDCKTPKLTINKEKTIFSSKAGGTAMVTGLRICNDSHITITRQYKDKIRLMLSLHSKQKLKETDLPILRGHLSYAKSVSPAFFSKVCLKYVHIIEDLL